MSSTAENDKAPAIEKESIGARLKAKYEKSSINKYLVGDGLTSDDVDTTMNTLALINALILTIPYSLAGSLDNQYWDWLQSTYASSECSDQCGKNDANNCFTSARQATLNSLFASVYSSIAVLCIVAVYYILRPTTSDKSEDDSKPESSGQSRRPSLIEAAELEAKMRVARFGNWWKQGRYVILIVFLFTFVSVTSVLTIFGALAGIYMTPTTLLCDPNFPTNNSVAVGCLFFIGFLILSTYFMM